MKFCFDIDKKSLFFGLKNDLTGHTATVATNLKQKKNTRPELQYFSLLKNVIDLHENPILEEECIKNSKSIVKINSFFNFKNIYVDNKKLQIEYSFGVYIKEEIDISAVQFGRIKLHYPISFKYYDEFNGLNIDNKRVLESISNMYFNSAFLIRSFEIDTDDSSLNFITTILGPIGTPSSSIFIDQKGGCKFVNTSTKKDLLAKQHVANLLVSNDEKYVYLLNCSNDDSFYDIDYISKSGEKSFVIVKNLSDIDKRIDISLYQYEFAQKVRNVFVYLVFEYDDGYSIEIISAEQLLKMKKANSTISLLL